MTVVDIASLEVNYQGTKVQYWPPWPLTHTYARAERGRRRLMTYLTG